MVDSASSPNERVQSARDRRSVPRYSLIAQAEVLEPVSGLRISGRISEVGRKGCYVDALNTLPVQTVVEVRIFRDQGSFHSPAKIVYTQEGIGMGIAFLDTPADQLQILDSWLVDLTPS